MLLPGLEQPIKESFLSVFQDVNERADAWVAYKKLLTIGANRYAKYLHQSAGYFALFGTNREAKIDQAYVSLVLTDQLRRERYRSSEEIEEELRMGGTFQGTRGGNSYTILEALESSDKSLAVVGVAGSGKTTAFRFLALRAAAGIEIRGRRRLPLYLPVREMETGTSIESAIESLFNQLEISRPKLVYRLLKKTGTLMLILDGIDETTDEHRSQLLRELTQLHRVAPEAIICVSGRPFSLSTDITGFSKWETLPLTVEARIAFVRKWFDPVDPQKGIRLAELCESNPELLHLGDRPLFLSIICALYYNELEVPSAPEELYDRAISGLMGQWDAFRNIARTTCLKELTIRDRQTLVSWLAFSMFTTGKKVFSPKEYLKQHGIQHVKSLIRKEIPAADDVLASLYNDFGILVEQSPNSYSFTHLSIQEYLTARHLVDFRVEKELIRYIDDPGWADVFYYVGRIMPDSTDLLLELHRRTELGSRTQAVALMKYWTAEPVFRRGSEKKMFARIFHGISEQLSALRVTDFELVNGTGLIIYLPDGSPPAFQRQSWLRQFPDILAIYLQMARSTKTSLASLGVSKEGVFAFLIAKNEPYISAVAFVRPT
jgi:hypothetical protein